MSRGKSGRNPAQILFVSISASRVDGGILRGAGPRAQWLDGAQFGIGLPALADEAVMVGAIARLEGELLACSGIGAVREVRAVIADSWLAQTTLPWTLSLKRPVTAQTSAATAIAAAGFDGDWAQPLRLDDAPYGLPRLVVAYPRAVIAALEKLAASLGASLQSLLPFSVAAWVGLMPKGLHGPQVLALVDRGLLVLAFGGGLHRGLSDILVRRLEEGVPQAHLLREAWQRACLRRPALAALDKVAVLVLEETAGGGMGGAPFEVLGFPSSTPGGVQPSRMLAVQARTVRHVLDGVPQRAVPSGGARLALSLGATLIMAMVGQLALTAQEREVLAARINEIRPVTAPVVVEPAWRRDELPKVQAVNAAIRELNLPIADILWALQPPADIRVAVLAVDTAVGRQDGRSSIKVTAEAPTGAEMARYVGFISERRPFVGAYLMKHEIIEVAPGQPYRFSVDVQWAD